MMIGRYEFFPINIPLLKDRKADRLRNTTKDHIIGLLCDIYEKINVDYAFDVGLAGIFAALELSGANPVAVPD